MGRHHAQWQNTASYLRARKRYITKTNTLLKMPKMLLADMLHKELSLSVQFKSSKEWGNILLRLLDSLVKNMEDRCKMCGSVQHTSY
ncbi:hypothetical protein TNCV_4927481 [Trichonephila clavipes]|nr:hypothetical protein TNCV_4927481 [Trichonephila clavipes]